MCYMLRPPFQYCYYHYTALSAGLIRYKGWMNGYSPSYLFSLLLLLLVFYKVIYLRGKVFMQLLMYFSGLPGCAFMRAQH